MSLAVAVERLVAGGGYVGLALAVVAENVFPPIPSEIILPLAGFEVARGRVTYVGALAAATAGSLVGAWIIYAIGRIGGRPLVLRLQPLLRAGPEDLARAERWFARRGDWIVLGARLVPGARSVVSAPAGLLRMGLWRFSVLTLAGSALWNAALISAGQALGTQWRGIAGVLGPVSTAVLVAAAGVLAAALVLVRRRARERRRTRAARPGQDAGGPPSTADSSR